MTCIPAVGAVERGNAIGDTASGVVEDKVEEAVLAVRKLADVGPRAVQAAPDGDRRALQFGKKKKQMRIIIRK